MRKNVVVLFLVLVFAAAGAMVGTARADLVTNGGFETGDLTGWTTFGTPAYGFASTGYNGLRSSLDGVSAYAGSYMLVLGNYASQGIAGVSQTLATTPGQQYNVSLFWADSGSNSPGYQVFQALWNGDVKYAISGETGSTLWTMLSFSVTGTGSDTLTLQGFSDSAYNNIDNVSVVKGAPVPVPGALLLFGPGLVGLAAIRKRFGM